MQKHRIWLAPTRRNVPLGPREPEVREESPVSLASLRRRQAGEKSELLIQGGRGGSAWGQLYRGALQVKVVKRGGAETGNIGHAISLAFPAHYGQQPPSWRPGARSEC